MRIETADVVVIGSGAGGGVLAWEAARRGLKTLVLERGPDVPPERMSMSEPEMSARLYKDGGLQLNTSLDMFILQGSCVGGSTVLSNMVLLRADPSVFARWRGLGAPVDAREMLQAYEHVETHLDARELPQEVVSESSRRFMQGAIELGLEPRWMRKGLGDCVGCGNCNVGCTFGTKRDSSRTWIPWAKELGARVLAETEVVKLKIRRGRVREIHCRTGPDRERLCVRARQVIVSAGAIGSSAILLKSGIRRNVGTRLSFNAGSMMVAEFGEPLDGYDADQMNVYLKGDGYCIEATHNPVMSAAMTTPGWLGEHHRLMRRFRNLAYAGALVQSEPVGEVVLSRWTGCEETRYRAPEVDIEKLRRGLKTIARSYLSAGADQVLLPTTTLRAIRRESELSEIDRVVRRPRDISFGTAHPQGGNPWSDDPEIGVIDRDFAVHEHDNLFVCDASVFPSCIGVNPIDTIMALSHVAAKRIFARAA